jgi:hypothetical protein
MKEMRAAFLVLVSALLLGGSAAAAQRTSRSGSAATATFTVRLTGQNHRPVARTTWRYVVRARNRAGRPVAGTAVVRVLVKGKVTDTVGWFGFKGTLRRTYRWSRKLQGRYAVLRAKVIGPGGSRIASYRVRVRATPTITGHPRFRATLRGENHGPVAGSAWRYVVRAKDAAGHPVAATAVVRAVVGGKIVDTVGWFGFKGVLRRTYRWSPILRGRDASLTARVIGPGGSRLLVYAVRVH